MARRPAASAPTGSDAARELDPARAALRERIARLDKDDVVDLCLGLTLRHGETYRTLMANVALVESRNSGAPLDTGPIREKAESIAWDFQNDEEGEPDTSPIDDFVGEAERRLKAGDARGALAILVTVADGLRKCFPDGYDNAPHGVPYVIGGVMEPLARTALAPGIPEGDRVAHAEILRGLRSVLPEYEDTLHAEVGAAHRAVAAGWHAPDVRAVLTGEAAGWPDAATALDEKRLAPFRSEWLAQRPVEAARVAAAGKPPLDRALEAHKAHGAAAAAIVARTSFTRCWEARALAIELWRDNADPAAPEAFALVADLGLDLPGEDPGDSEHRDSIHAHASWLAFSANAPETRTLALKAARIAFSAKGSHGDYEMLKRVAGKEWPAIRGEAIAELGGRDASPDRVRILMDEGEHALAARFAGDALDMEDAALKDMVAAVQGDLPEWASRACEVRGRAILDTRRSKSFRAGAAWLGRAAEAFLAAERPADARTLAAAFVRDYGRNRELRSMMEAIVERVEKRIGIMERAAERAAVPVQPLQRR